MKVMVTKVTQKQWVDIMEDNPSWFTNDDVEVNGKLVRMQPNHPVENMTWWSAIVFAHRLSEKDGLKPAYDLSQVKFKGCAEDGTLEAVHGELFINARDGNIYHAEGLRLPTDAESEYLSNSRFPHNLDESLLKNYAWFRDNSDNKTHAVGTAKQSFELNNQKIYDLIGNVWEWNHDWLESLEGGTDPCGPKHGDAHSVHGGCWSSTASDILPTNRSVVRSNTRSSSVGIRLVQTQLIGNG